MTPEEFTAKWYRCGRHQRSCAYLQKSRELAHDRLHQRGRDEMLSDLRGMIVVAALRTTEALEEDPLGDIERLKTVLVRIGGKSVEYWNIVAAALDEVNRDFEQRAMAAHSAGVEALKTGTGSITLAALAAEIEQP